MTCAASVLRTHDQSSLLTSPQRKQGPTPCPCLRCGLEGTKTHPPTGSHASWNVSATARFVTFLRQMLTPCASPAFSRMARSKPFFASCKTYGSVTLHRAYVLVRPTAPGMFVTQ